MSLETELTLSLRGPTIHAHASEGMAPTVHSLSNSPHASASPRLKAELETSVSWSFETSVTDRQDAYPTFRF